VQNREEIGTLIKVAGALGMLMLLTIMVQAFVTYHSREISTASEWSERQLAHSSR